MVVQAIIVVALGLLVITVARIEGILGRTVAVTEQVSPMGTLTFSTTINGVTYTRTYVQQEGESDADFEMRALRLWSEFLARIGGQ